MVKIKKSHYTMNLNRILKASRFASPPIGEPINLNIFILLPLIVFSLLYPFVAAFHPNLLKWIDTLLSPAVDALHWIGMGIIKPPMEGPSFTERFYTNETGIAVWAAVLYSGTSIILSILGIQPLLRNREEAHQSVMQKYGWGPIRAWLFMHAVLLFFIVPFGLYCTACLLNGMYGWYVFHIDSYSVAALPIVVFVFPGVLVMHMWLGVLSYIFHDCNSLILFVLRQYRGQ